MDGLNLAVEEGDIFGFVGPNGAGKTSTIRIMATLLQATRGDILVAGHSVRRQSREVRRVIGYMPDFFGVYGDMLVWEYLDFFGACYDLDPAKRSTLINDLLELVDLSHRRNDPVEGLSRGMKQRLSLARTLIHDPQVLILDEPASGLDPRARVEIRELLVELAHMGKTIFFSTHILADVAEICTHVGIIEAGKLVASGSLEELQMLVMPHRVVQITLVDPQTTIDLEDISRSLSVSPGVLNVRISAQHTAPYSAPPYPAEAPSPSVETHELDTAPLASPAATDLETAQISDLNHPSPHQVLRHRLEIDFQGDDQALSGLLAHLLAQGIPVLHFSEDSRDLESVFMRATKGMVT